MSQTAPAQVDPGAMLAQGIAAVVVGGVAVAAALVLVSLGNLILTIAGLVSGTGLVAHGIRTLWRRQQFQPHRTEE